MPPLTVYQTRNLTEAIEGCLLGTAVGDAIGLPTEGLTRTRQRRLFGPIVGHRLLFGRGLVSDDTEHAVLVAQALIRSSAQPPAFESALASGLRRWFALLPPGIGFATLRACLRLTIGIPPSRSGVFSAGNGPAMRAPLLGVACGADPVRLRDLIRISTRITHTDPRAEYAALAVSLASIHSALGDDNSQNFLTALRTNLPNDDAAAELLHLADAAISSAEAGEETTAFAARVLSLPERITGYSYHTVPAALHAWRRYPDDYRQAVLSVIACGGDTDTTAAIVGGIVGAGVGAAGIPGDWLASLIESPCNVAWMRRLAADLAASLANESSVETIAARLPALALRNALFLCVVLYHGLRRLVPYPNR